jgi:ribonuclease P/MRP protein subunit POP5
VKHLPKHLRPRWRYLAVELDGWPDAGLDRTAFQRELWFAAQNLVGDAGSAELDLSVLRFEFEDGWGTAVVRTHRGETERARGVLACLDAVDGHEIGVRVRGVSGTVRACEEKYIRRQPIEPEQRRVVFESETRSAFGHGRRVDVRCDGTFAGTTELDLR